MLRSELFSQAGAALCGPTWKNHLARVLGPYHPDGPRDQVDPRLVRRWAKGDRPIPDWVLATLRNCLRDKATLAQTIITDINCVLCEES